MSYKQIPDISTFDKSVDFAKVRRAGYAGVIIRAGYGQTHVDDYFYEHIQGAIEAGLPVGIYWFSYAYTVDMAKEEARKCISLIKPYTISLPVYFDFEGDSMRYAKAQGHPVSNLLLNQMAVAFCSAVRKAGYTPGIYFNKDYRDNKYAKEVLESYSQWYAYYNKSLDAWAEGIDLWQYTSTGEVPGIPAEDEDISYLVNNDLIQSTKGDSEGVSESEDKIYVKTLQTALNVSYGLNLPVDGIWGEMTEAAVRLYYLYYKRPAIKNAHVSWVQEMLCKCGSMTEIDGSYGPKTCVAVKDFQANHGLLVDGWAGPATHKKLLEVAINE